MQISETLSKKVWIGLALVTLYAFWGSSYWVNQVCLKSLPALALMSLRFISAGALLLIVAFVRNAPPLERAETLRAAISGIFLVGSNTVVAVAQEHMPSASVAVLVGTVPLWAFGCVAIIDGNTNWSDWRPLLIAFGGILSLTLGWQPRYPLWPSLFLLVSTAIWGATSVWLRRAGFRIYTRTLGVQLLTGGIAVLAIAGGIGQKVIFPPSIELTLAFVFLVIGPSILAYGAYNFLLRTTHPSLATSYAFVCPLIATMLGVTLLRERLDSHHYVALVLILVSLMDLLVRRRRGVLLLTPPVELRTGRLTEGSRGGFLRWRAGRWWIGGGC